VSRSATGGYRTHAWSITFLDVRSAAWPSGAGNHAPLVAGVSALTSSAASSGGGGPAPPTIETVTPGSPGLFGTFTLTLNGAPSDPIELPYTASARDLADALGALEELPEAEAAIGLVHPLELDPSGLQAWQAHLSRFKVVPPFPQLERPVERCEPTHHNRRQLSTAEGQEISYATFRSRAEKRGWVRGSVVDAGGISSYYKLFPGAGVEVSLDTGDMYVGMDPMETLTLGTTRFCTAGSIQRGSYVYDEPTENDPRILTFSQVPPVVYSETVSDLKAIIARKQEQP
jgi:hypothetical protein